MNKILLCAMKYLLLLLLCMQLTACTALGFGGSSTASTPLSQASTQERQIAQAVFDALNKDRLAEGLPALQWSNALAQSARGHNRAMMQANQLEHQMLGEPELGEREKQQGIQWLQAAENVGYTEDMTEQGALSLHRAMMAESPPNDGHRQNILSTESNQVGIDILLDPEHNKLWLTEDFARVL